MSSAAWEPHALYIVICRYIEPDEFEPSNLYYIGYCCPNAGLQVLHLTESASRYWDWSNSMASAVLGGAIVILKVAHWDISYPTRITALLQRLRQGPPNDNIEVAVNDLDNGKAMARFILSWLNPDRQAYEGAKAELRGLRRQAEMMFPIDSPGCRMQESRFCVESCPMQYSEFV
ncbi:hypothetical protein CALVIDRAFT_579831 [Calocera viscosa TUFC12733]|uniref:Uncharacterized protein n=1 Tax=Calocera viscosa (strain TUFC12733) TaxID=1330018 RepID=A0A167KG64_CALVF|nr:hypothetical protein CALVIDRAFT_579831 [Calocera viscosa TUFC12733]